MSVPEMWKRLFLFNVNKAYYHSIGIVTTYHNTQDTYSPVGKRNLRMYCSGVQSTGAEMRKYLTDRKELSAKCVSLIEERR